MQPCPLSDTLAFLFNLLAEILSMCDINTDYPPVGFFKRLIVIVYDLLLLTALLFSVGVVVAGIMTFALNNGNAITDAHPFYFASQLIILAVLVFSGFLFYRWFWTHGGQTLGMKTWKVQLVSADGHQINSRKAALRYSGAIISLAVFGLGFIWSIFDKQKRTWHDMLSATRLVQLPNK